MASKAEEGSYERERLERRFKNSNPDSDVQSIDFEGEYDSSLSKSENVENIERNTGVKLQTKAEIASESGIRNIKTQEDVFKDEREEKQIEYMEKKYGVGYNKERKPRIVTTRDYEKEKQANVYRQLTPLEKAKVFIHTTIGSKYGRQRMVEGAVKVVGNTGRFVEEKTAGSLGPRRYGVAGFVFGRSNKPPLAPKYSKKYSSQPNYVAQQMRRPVRRPLRREFVPPQERVRHYDVGPQSQRSDALPQHFGPARDYRVASNLRLFDTYAVGSPIAKYGGNGKLPRFWDSKPSTNTRNGMFKKGVFG